MSLSLSDAQLDTITSKLFLFGDPAVNMLPTPVNTNGASGFADIFSSIVLNPAFNGWGIGVADFTTDAGKPQIWMKDSDKAWRIWSTAKISILLAAIQLRADVRAVALTDLITEPADYDALFKTIWQRSKLPYVKEISGLRAPRISTIFDINAHTVDFQGASSTPDFTTTTMGKLPQNGNVSWDISNQFNFLEKLWLTGARSDDVAAHACISEIGISYLKAVQRAYGLFHGPYGYDPSTGKRSPMRLLLSSGYHQIDYRSKGIKASVTKDQALPTYRKYGIKPDDLKYVTDAYHGGAGRYKSTQGGSAAAMTAFMVELMRPDDDSGKLSWSTIQSLLSGDNSGANQNVYVHSDFLTGVRVALGPINGAKIVRACTKVGFVTDSPISADFAYIEVRGAGATKAPHDTLKFGIVGAGMKLIAAPADPAAAWTKGDLAAAVFGALLTLYSG